MNDDDFFMPFMFINTPTSIVVLIAHCWLKLDLPFTFAAAVITMVIMLFLWKKLMEEVEEPMTETNETHPEFQINDAVYWGEGTDEEAGIIKAFSMNGALAYIIDYRWKYHQVPVTKLIKIGPRTEN
jgi:hypothetical protein